MLEQFLSMAEQDKKLSEEELGVVRNLLEPLDQADPDQIFNPHLSQFRLDVAELQPAASEEDSFADFADIPSDFPPEEGASDLLSGSGGPGLADDFGLGDAALGDNEPVAPSDDLAQEPSGFDDLDLGEGSSPADPMDLGIPATEIPTDTDDLGLGDLGKDEPTSGEGGGDFDLGDLGLPDEPPASADEPTAAGDMPDFGDLDLGDDTQTEAPSAEDAFDLGDLGETTTEDPGNAEPAEAGDFDLGDLGLSDEPTEADDALGGDLGGDFDLGDLDATQTPDAAGDDFDLGGDSGPTDFDLDATPSTGDFDLGDSDPGALDLGDSDSGDLDLGDSTADALGMDDSDPGALDLGDPVSGDLDTGSSDLDLGAPAAGDFDLGGGDLDFSDLEATPAPSGADQADQTPATVAEPLTGFDDLPGDDGDLGDSLLDSGDLSDMAEQAKMQTGIGDEFTDEDLANLRTNLNDYPSGIKKSVVDIVVNEKIDRAEQRELVNLVIAEASPEEIADFVETRLGYRPDTSPPQVTKDGVPIIYAEGMSPEEQASRRRRARLIAAGALLAVVGVMGGFGVFYFLGQRSIRGLYEQGLEELTAARVATGDEKLARKKAAEEYFQRALARAGGKYDVEYLNRYGISYMKAGYPEDAFRKLFGEVTPAYGTTAGGTPDPKTAWNRPGRRAPLVRAVDPSEPFSAPTVTERGITPEGHGTIITDQDGGQRRVEFAGALIVDRVRDRELRRRTLINLARFHSQTSRGFLDSPAGEKYKNDGLAIDYYRLILTLMNEPKDLEAIAGIGDIHYNRAEYGEAARQYNKIIEQHPLEITGHAGLLNTYIEIWAAKGKSDPRWVIAKHREIQKLDLEEKLPIYVMTKLAGFYIDLDPDTLRIKYQVDPKDQLTGLEIRDNSIRLLEMIFRGKETRDEETIVGSRYGEGFYQRGRFLLSRGETTRALQQFQNAHQYDPRHYLAVNEMGEHYKRQLDFTKARRYFEEALSIHEATSKSYGGRPEDETLVKGDVGKLYYNLGSLIFLRNAGLPEKGAGGFLATRLYPARAMEWTAEQKERIQLLGEARAEFQKALPILKDERAKQESIYWLGWIEYVNGNFDGALEQWSDLDTLYEENYSDPVLLMARGNAYYYTQQLRAALGNYRKVLDDYERKALDVTRPNPSDKAHSELYLTLSAVSNNIGAVYEREYMELTRTGDADPGTLAELEKSALRHYFMSIDLARKVDYDNEIARTNQRLAFKYLNPDTRTAGGQSTRLPLIDDWVAPVLPSLREGDTAEGRMRQVSSAN